MRSDPSSTCARPDSPLAEAGKPSKDGPESLAGVRETRPGDFADIFELTRKTYPHEQPWRAEELASHLERFPQGQLVAVDTRGRIVGMTASLQLREAEYPLEADYMALTGGLLFRNHDPRGDTLYAAEVMVDPDMRGRGVGKALYEARRQLARRAGVRRIRATARLRGYHRHADRLDPVAYASEVIRGRLGDPTLSFQLKQGFRVRGVIRDFTNDPETLGYAAVIEWPSEPAVRRFVRPRRPRVENGLAAVALAV